MKIFSASQIKAWDSFTIQHEPVKPIELMERAATACSNWIRGNLLKPSAIKIFCGRGNNGGDGVAIARHLSAEYKVSVFILQDKKEGSPDFEKNLQRLKKTSAKIFYLENENAFPELTKKDLLIDAIFGTGLNKKPAGFVATLIDYMNHNAASVISIDVPSGLYIDKSSTGNSITKASYTLTFQNQKLAFLMPENAAFVGNVVLLDIRLSNEFEVKE